jgi:hypothetical protein
MVEFQRRLSIGSGPVKVANVFSRLFDDIRRICCAGPLVSRDNSRRLQRLNGIAATNMAVNAGMRTSMIDTLNRRRTEYSALCGSSTATPFVGRLWQADKGE